MNRWQEHLPVASLALSPLFERATSGGVQFSAAERALFTASEFWVAIKTRTLVAHLGPHNLDALRYLSIVYSAMGAHHVARILTTGVGEMGDTATPQDRLKCLTALQERMVRTHDSVDQLIAGLAHKLGLSSVTRPDRVAEPDTVHIAGPALSWRQGGSSRAWWAVNP